MKKRSFCIGACVLYLLLSMGTSPLLAFANSAQSWFEGVDGNGAIMPDTESPIVVEKERLTLDIQEFPKNRYENGEEYLAYSARVTAEYTFYNPSEYTVTAKLLFPFGNAPNYASEYRGDDDTDKYEITVDGVPVERKIRHTLSDGMGGFDLETDLPLVQEGFVEDEFYTQDLTVTKYTFEISGVATWEYPAAHVATDIPKGLSDYRLCLADINGASMQADGDIRIHTSVDRHRNKTFELYVFGTPLSTLPEWQAYEDGGVKDGEEMEGSVELVRTETTTFQAFALEKRSEDSAVSEYDWYNAVVYALKDSQESSPEHPLVYDRRTRFTFDDKLMRWYEYEISLAPNTRIVNTVTAPLYPAIDLGYEPSIYEYTYLLSPAKTWKSFGELELVINTPYYLIESSVDAFQKTEGGYAVTLDGLPEGELTFTLCTSESPEGKSSSYMLGFVILIVSAFAVPILLLGGVIAIVVVIWKICKKRKKSKKRRTR